MDTVADTVTVTVKVTVTIIVTLTLTLTKETKTNKASVTIDPHPALGLLAMAKARTEKVKTLKRAGSDGQNFSTPIFSSSLGLCAEQKMQKFHSEILASLNFNNNEILSPGLENNNTLKCCFANLST